jgi:hypothetical protein
MRALISMVLFGLVAGCGSVSEGNPGGRVMIVDRLGNPVQDALVLPESEDGAALPRDTMRETKDRTSNAQGMVRADLDDYLWSSDACYHFRIHRAGFEDAELTVSRDLFPAVLKIEMRATARPGS